MSRGSATAPMCTTPSYLHRWQGLLSGAFQCGNSSCTQLPVPAWLSFAVISAITEPRISQDSRHHAATFEYHQRRLRGVPPRHTALRTPSRLPTCGPSPACFPSFLCSSQAEFPGMTIRTASATTVYNLGIINLSSLPTIERSVYYNFPIIL